MTLDHLTEQERRQVLASLARVKALFQLRTIVAVITERPADQKVTS